MNANKPYTCTEITVDVRIEHWNVRLWIGTNGLADSTEIAWRAHDAVAALQHHDCRSAPEAQFIVEYARQHIPRLNAVQVREQVIGDWIYEVGVMGYTQPFEDNDRERFGLLY